MATQSSTGFPDNLNWSETDLTVESLVTESINNVPARLGYFYRQYLFDMAAELGKNTAYNRILIDDRRDEASANPLTLSASIYSGSDTGYLNSEYSWNGQSQLNPFQQQLWEGNDFFQYPNSLSGDFFVRVRDGQTSIFPPPDIQFYGGEASLSYYVREAIDIYGNVVTNQRFPVFNITE